MKILWSVLVLALALGGRVAEAQTPQPYTLIYTGLPFITGPGCTYCTAGYLSATATVLETPGSGTQILSYTATAIGIGATLSSPANDCPAGNSSIQTINGKMDYWGLTLTNPCPVAYPMQYIYSGGPGVSDQVETTDGSGTPIATGSNVSGTWTSSKSLGKPCCRAGGAVASVF